MRAPRNPFVWFWAARIAIESMKKPMVASLVIGSRILIFTTDETWLVGKPFRAPNILPNRGG